MEQVFSYIISLGAAVMMPILFTIIGLCIGMKFGKALKSGLFVGVGFIGLNVVTKLLTDNFTSPLEGISDLYQLALSVFDMGWPAAAAVAYNTAVGALIIPILLGVNFLMLITKCTSGTQFVVVRVFAVAAHRNVIRMSLDLYRRLGIALKYLTYLGKHRK